MNKRLISIVVIVALAVTGMTVISPIHKNVSASIASPLDNVWEPLWSDEFNGTSLDTSVWNYQVGPGKNNEAQCYRQENVSVDEGCLKLRAQREDSPYSYNGKSYNYTSGRIDTKHKKWFKYGKIEAKIKVDNGNHNGLWPAFWMQGEDRDIKGWPKCGEIDIMEHANDRGYYTGAVHWTNSSGSQSDQSKECYFTDNSNHGIDDWHTYTIVWDETQIKWYMDYEQSDNPQPFYTQKTSASNSSSLNACINETKTPNDGFFLLLNLAVGGSNTSYTGGLVPDANFDFATMNVDYVRVYQYNQNLTTNAPTTTVAPTTTETPSTTVASTTVTPTTLSSNTTVDPETTESETEEASSDSILKSSEDFDLTWYNAANNPLVVPLGDYSVLFKVHRAYIGLCPNHSDHIRIKDDGGNTSDAWALEARFDFKEKQTDKNYKVKWTVESSEETRIGIVGKGYRQLNKGVNVIEFTLFSYDSNQIRVGLSEVPYQTVLDLYDLTITEETTGEVVYPVHEEPTQEPTEQTTVVPITTVVPTTEEPTTSKPSTIIREYTLTDFVEYTFEEDDENRYEKIDGYLFAGWTIKDSKAYAKYIDEKVFNTKWQANSNFSSIRFVNTVDSLEYKELGVIISGEYDNKTILEQKKEMTKVYSSIKADGKTIYPKSFSDASNYFFTYTIRNINPRKDLNIYIQPYYVTLDGTKVLGERKNFYFEGD